MQQLSDILSSTGTLMVLSTAGGCGHRGPPSETIISIFQNLLLNFQDITS